MNIFLILDKSEIENIASMIYFLDILRFFVNKSNTGVFFKSVFFVYLNCLPFFQKLDMVTILRTLI